MQAMSNLMLLCCCQRTELVHPSLIGIGALDAGQEPRPLENPLIFGNYDVAYVSAGPSQDGAREHLPPQEWH